MNTKGIKSSVVIEPYESKRSPNKDDSKTNLSTMVRSEGSGRKWKVSESITPVMSEFDRFSLRVTSETSFNNRSHGSLNESFEKNLLFNLQNSFATSYSSDSRNKKVSISAAPLIKSISVTEINVIRDTQTLMEVENENDDVDFDVDDVCLSSCSDEPNDHNASPTQESNAEQVPIEDSLEPKEVSIPTEHVFIQPSTTLIGLAKDSVPENVPSKREKFPEFNQPVDIDASQSSLITKQMQLQSPISEHSCVISEVSSYQQSKLCDTTKAYIMSQDSSLISSPMDRDVLKSALSLPGRTNGIQGNTDINDLPSPILFTNEPSAEAETIIKKSPFYKSTFTQRRLRELNRFDDSIEVVLDKRHIDSKIRQVKKDGKPKPKPKPKPKEPKEKKPKPVTKKPIRKRKENVKPKDDNVLTVDSAKVQMKNIVIEDSENDKYDQPIEKARGDHSGSDDELFSFTPEIITKRKRKITKKPKPVSKRMSKASTVYDIISDMSSPSPIKLSYTSMKSADEARKNRLGDEIIGSRFSLRNIVSGFESDLEQMKILQLSMTYQLNQFKEMTKNLSFQSP